MSYQVVNQQLVQFYGNDSLPLENGQIYIGTANLNPETNQIAVYWDSDLTQPASQPIRTIAGFPSRNGVASRIYASINNGPYSITVKDKNGVLINSKLSSDYILTDVTVGPVSQQIAIDAATASAASISASNSATSASNSASTALSSANSASSSALVSAAYANIQWAGFSLSDGELIVTYANGATSIPSLVDGEFIITY